MATNINTLKNWFKTKLKPTQEQFWAWMDSYWHKDETIPIGKIENLNDKLGGLATTESVENLAETTAESFDNVTQEQTELSNRINEIDEKIPSKTTDLGDVSFTDIEKPSLLVRDEQNTVTNVDTFDKNEDSSITLKQEYMSTILQGKGVDNVTLRKRDGKLEWIKDNDYETPTLKFRTLASEEEQYFMFGSSGIIGKYNNVEFEEDYSGPLVEDAEMEVTHIHGIKCLRHLGLNHIKGDLDLRCISTPSTMHISNSVIDNLSLSSRKAVVGTSAGFYASKTTFLKPIDFSVSNKFYHYIYFQDCIMSQEVLESTLESLLCSFASISYGLSANGHLVTFFPIIDISYNEIESEIEYAGRLESLIQTLNNSGWSVNIPQSWWSSKKQQRDFSKVNYEKLEAEWLERYGFRINK